MAKSNDLVWYIGYGSNLLRERFLCYINGGCAEGSDVRNPGCTDQTLPLRDEPITLGHNIYFAKEADVWGKSAACFLDPSVGGAAYGRQYLITRDQLIEISAQENGVEANLMLDFDAAIASGGSDIGSDVELPYYNYLLYIGEHDDYSQFTITYYPKVQTQSAPSPVYLKTIAEGLRQSHGLSDEQIDRYLN